jgi:hypothetical protein
MMSDSVITRTGQLWKFVLAIVLLLIGSFLPLFENIGMTWTVGTIVAVAGYGFALAFIQCPVCNVRWFWKALMYAEIYGPLMKRPECPMCKHQFGES